MRVVWLILMLCAGTCFGETPTVCPWFSIGSAATLLGGTVAQDLHIDSNGQGTCRFTRDQQSIEIRIGKVETHACPGRSTRMIGLGNEAVQCKLTNAAGQEENAIAGRVRDVYFVISVRDPQTSPAPPTTSTQYDDPESVSVVARVAEQVVGNLY